MKIFGIGTDIIRISYFRQKPFKLNVSLYHKIFTQKEIEYCLAKSDPYQHFAVRFAAKEAIIKAGGLKLANMSGIEIFHDKTGRPHARITRIKRHEVNVLISLSHTKDYAIAFAVWLN